MPEQAYRHSDIRVTPVVPWVVVELHYCGSCGKLVALPCGFKYCWKCAQHLLSPDPIDVAIREMITQQENLLKRKYIRRACSEAHDNTAGPHSHFCPNCRTKRKCEGCAKAYVHACCNIH